MFDLDNTLTRHGTYTPFLWHAARRRPLRLAWLPLLLAAGLGCALGLLGREHMKALMLRAVLGGIDEQRLNALAAGFAERLCARGLRPGAAAALAGHRAAGDTLVLATAAFEFCAQPLARHLGFHHCVASRAQIRDGRLTGAIEGVSCRGAEKLTRVRRALPAAGAAGHVVAYSDHHVDLPLLEWADEAVAVNPTRRLARAARSRGWRIEHW